jgi:hypothetical protein
MSEMKKKREMRVVALARKGRGWRCEEAARLPSPADKETFA